MGALAANREILAVTQATVRSHIEMALDISRHISPKISFDLNALVDDLANFNDVVISQVVALKIQRNAGLL
jgi:hypothetical protein